MSMAILRIVNSNSQPAEAIQPDLTASLHYPHERTLGLLGSVRPSKLGGMRAFSKREVREFYRRLAETRPIPQTELEFINPFTLLVAVVLSAQATDSGVNKATPALFALADTPQKMLAVGEERIVELIRTIGLFRT